jgi:hypothetical protein
MSLAYLSLLSAFGGALVGMAVVLAGVFVQAKIGGRRKRRRQIAALLVEYHRYLTANGQK